MARRILKANADPSQESCFAQMVQGLTLRRGNSALVHMVQLELNPRTEIAAAR